MGLAIPWREDEEAVLREYYATEGLAVHHRLPGRTASACAQHARVLNIQNRKITLWTEEEDRILREHYQTCSRQEVVQMLPGRTLNECVYRARQLDLTNKTKAAARMKPVPPWTEEEDAVLREWYPTEGPECGLRMDRPRNVCRIRARELGLQKRGRAWTAEEDDALREWFPHGQSALEEHLPGRTWSACQSRADRIGLTTPRPKWTKKEDRILHKYWTTDREEALSRLSAWSEATCQARARLLGYVSRSNNPWTEEELDILREYYPSEGPDVCRRIPAHGRQSCIVKANLLGLAKKMPRWTEVEDDILREFFWTEGEAVAERLPGRSFPACQHRYRTLQAAEGKAGSKEPLVKWTKEEDDILRKYYPSEGRQTLERLPNRTWLACINRLKILRARRA